MPIISDIQKLNPGDKIQLLVIDGSKFKAPVLPIHSHYVPYTANEIKAGTDFDKLPAKPIIFNKRTYSAWPYEISGLSSSGDGQSAEPTLRVANLNGRVSSMCYDYDDMVQAKITIIDTFAHYLDAANGAFATDPQPDQVFKQVWYIDSKVSEDNEIVEFRLSSPIDLDGLVIPTRQITGLCTWACRDEYKKGNGCMYNPTHYGNRMFDADGNPVTDEALDKCSGLLSDCIARFGKDNEIDFGGFPGAQLLRR